MKTQYIIICIVTAINFISQASVYTCDSYMEIKKEKEEKEKKKKKKRKRYK